MNLLPNRCRKLNATSEEASSKLGTGLARELRFGRIRLAESQEGLHISQSYDTTQPPNPFELSNILIALRATTNGLETSQKTRHWTYC
jgi:hypothetical protein